MARTYRRAKIRTGASCWKSGKTSFRSTGQAWRFVETREVWNGDVARVYRCEWCDWFHLTSQPTRWEVARAG